MEKDFAVLMTGGKQYKVSAGDKLQVEKLDAKEGETVTFETVLLHAAVDGAVEVGTPYIAGAALTAKVLGDVRGKKKITFKYHSKTRARRKKGHRQDYTEIEIVKI
jgi:large subunit ribosomal protein L21